MSPQRNTKEHWQNKNFRLTCIAMHLIAWLLNILKYFIKPKKLKVIWPTAGKHIESQEKSENVHCPFYFLFEYVKRIFHSKDVLGGWWALPGRSCTCNVSAKGAPLPSLKVSKGSLYNIQYIVYMHVRSRQYVYRFAITFAVGLCCICIYFCFVFVIQAKFWQKK